MQSPHVKELLSEYLDKVLDSETASRVKNHLAICSECQSEENSLMASWALLGSLEAIEPSPDFRVRFWERVRAEEEKEVSWHSFPRLIPLMAGVLGVWVVGVGLGSYLFLRSPQAKLFAASLIQQQELFDDVSNLGSAYLKRMSRGNV